MELTELTNLVSHLRSMMVVTYTLENDYGRDTLYRIRWSLRSADDGKEIRFVYSESFDESDAISVSYIAMHMCAFVNMGGDRCIVEKIFNSLPFTKDRLVTLAARTDGSQQIVAHPQEDDDLTAILIDDYPHVIELSVDDLESELSNDPDQWFKPRLKVSEFIDAVPIEST